MAVKKIIMRPEGGNDYADELHPKTSADQIAGQILFQTVSGTNTYTVTDANVSAYTPGLRVTIKFTNANTGASTLNINGLGAKSIVKAGGGALSSGNLKAGGVYTLVYDGVNFQLQGEGGEYGTATASDVLAGKTIGTDTGIVSGSIPSKGSQTFTPGTANQTIASGQYLSGTQTILGDPDLISANIKSGANIFGVSGNSNVVDTSAGDAVAADIYPGKKAYVDGALITGTMATQAAQTITPGTTNKTIASGRYLTGIQTISGSSNLTASNIKSGVNIFGVVGNVEEFALARGNQIITEDSEVYETANNIWKNSVTVTFNRGGTVRVSYILDSNNTQSGYPRIATSRIYRNGSIYKTHTSSTIYETVTYDVPVTAGGTIYISFTNPSGTFGKVRLREFKTMGIVGRLAYLNV